MCICTYFASILVACQDSLMVKALDSSVHPLRPNRPLCHMVTAWLLRSCQSVTRRVATPLCPQVRYPPRPQVGSLCVGTRRAMIVVWMGTGGRPCSLASECSSPQMWAWVRFPLLTDFFSIFFFHFLLFSSLFFSTSLYGYFKSNIIFFSEKGI